MRRLGGSELRHGRQACAHECVLEELAAQNKQKKPCLKSSRVAARKPCAACPAFYGLLSHAQHYFYAHPSPQEVRDACGATSMQTSSPSCF